MAAINNLFIAGGSGTLGKELVALLYTQCSRITIYSRTESRQEAMRDLWPEYPDNKLRYILGDIQDLGHLRRIIPGHDTVIHAAAMKFIDRSEYNALECLRNNVDGTRNMALACAESKVKNALFVSSDKACNPVSLYGASKMIGERVWGSANNLSRTCKFNCCRYGNVIGSTGSVFQKWSRMSKAGLPITVTHPDMTRYFWLPAEAAVFAISSLQEAQTHNDRGVVYVSKMQSYHLDKIARSYSDNIMYTGLRCLEKVHEDLISEHESDSCYDCGSYYAIFPVAHDWINNLPVRGDKVPEGFALRSSDNPLEDLES